MHPELHRTSHHGTTLLWADLPGPLEATLVFGVGAADEPPHLLGVSHLLEHLLLRGLEPSPAVANGTTGPRTMSFEVVGSDDVVVDFMHGLAETIRLGALTEDMLALERRVMDVEAGPSLAPAVGLATARFGLGSVGHADAGVPTLPGIDLDEVKDWLSLWCTAENAVLVLTGPPPPDLAVRLPSGPRPLHDAQVPRLVSGTLSPSPKSGVAVSLLLPHTMRHLLGDALQFELLRELRHERGLLYAIDDTSFPVDSSLGLVNLVLEVEPEDAVRTAELAVTTLRRLAERGLPGPALVHALEVARAALGHPTAWPQHLLDRAEHALLGGPTPVPPHERLAELESLAPHTLREELATSLRTLLVMVEDELDDLEPSPRVEESLADRLGLAWDDQLAWRAVDDGSRPLDGQTYRGSGWGWRDSVSLDQDHLWGVVGGERRRIALADVAVLGRFADGSLALIDDRGRSTVVDLADWRRSSRLVADLRTALAHVPERDFSWFDDPPHRRGARPDANRL